MKAFSLLAILFIATSFAPKNNEIDSVYKIKRVGTPPKIDAVWDKVPWKNIRPISISNYMGEKPGHIPFTQAKLAYDNYAVYVIFRVEDRYVKAVHENNQESICKDSCVEFFFSPHNNSSEGYFNLEMNCGGVFLFNYQITPKSERTEISDGDMQLIEVAHTLPKIIKKEIKNKTTWVVEYSIPFSVLQNYDSFSAPQKGTVWRANFYKCADHTSHPHWLTWAPVDNPTPNFHLPGFFGAIEFQ